MPVRAEPAACRCAGAGVGRLEHEQCRERRHDDQHLLGVRAADPRDENEAGDHRAGDRADRVRGVTPPASRAASCSVMATLASASGKLAPHNIAPGSTTQKQRTRSSWQRVPRRRDERRVDRPVRQRLGELVGRPRHRPAHAAADTSPARGADSRRCARPTRRPCCRCRGRRGRPRGSARRCRRCRRSASDRMRVQITSAPSARQTRERDADVDRARAPPRRARASDHDVRPRMSSARASSSAIAATSDRSARHGDEGRGRRRQTRAADRSRPARQPATPPAMLPP